MLEYHLNELKTYYMSNQSRKTYLTYTFKNLKRNGK